MRFRLMVPVVAAALFFGVGCSDDSSGSSNNIFDPNDMSASDMAGNNVQDTGNNSTQDMSADMLSDAFIDQGSDLASDDMGSNPPYISPDVRSVDRVFTRLTAGRDFVCGQNGDNSWQCWGMDTFQPITGRPNLTFTQISAGNGFSCGVSDTNELRCWGNASRWQLPAGDFVYVSSGQQSACAIDTNQGVHCFGDPQKDVIKNNTPVNTGFVKIDVGDSHACGRLADGNLQCWGDNAYGQNAIPTRSPYADFMVFGSTTCGIQTGGDTTCWGVEPMGAAATQPDYTALSDTHSGACGIGPRGELECWDNGYYELIEDHPLNMGFLEVVGGFGFACGRTATSLVCWGNGESGVLAGMPGILKFNTMGVSDGLTCGLLADGTPECFGLIFRELTSDFPPDDVVFDYVQTAGDNACGIAQGTIHCWGDRPTPSPTEPTGWVQLVSGRRHFCGRRLDGTVRCWGSSFGGNLNAPTNAQFKTIAAGGNRTCGINNNDEFLCWGTVGNTATPLGPQATDIIGVSSSETCAVRTDSQVDCWTSSGISSQTRGSATWVEGGSVMCALNPDKSLRCWGDSGNRSGQGIATTPSGAFDSVHVGSDFACAVQSDEEWRCWGGYVR